MFALVDCNNFYATCEALFRPALRGKPVVVLSNNDGCVVARSAEAKALGLKMGVPAFQIKEMIDRHGIEVFSSNYALYADMSHRVMTILIMLAPALEIYSIDEAFLDVRGIDDPHAFGLTIRKTIRQWTGITVAVGIAPTKTLAKLANYGAKKYSGTGGVVVLSEANRQRKLMGITPVDEVWGVGRKLNRQLNALGIQTALDLCQHDRHGGYPPSIQRGAGQNGCRASRHFMPCTGAGALSKKADCQLPVFRSTDNSYRGYASGGLYIHGTGLR